MAENCRDREVRNKYQDRKGGGVALKEVKKRLKKINDEWDWTLTLALTPKSTPPDLITVVVDRDAALGHHPFKIAVANRVPAVLAHRPEDELAAEVASLEIVHAATPSLQSMQTVRQSDRSLQQSRARRVRRGTATTARTRERQDSTSRPARATTREKGNGRPSPGVMPTSTSSRGTQRRRPSAPTTGRRNSRRST